MTPTFQGMATPLAETTKPVIPLTDPVKSKTGAE